LGVAGNTFWVFLVLFLLGFIYDSFPGKRMFWCLFTDGCKKEEMAVSL